MTRSLEGAPASDSKHPAGNCSATDERPRGAQTLLWNVLAVLIAICIFAWPSVVNRGPFFIPDTTAYIRSADAAFSSQFNYSSIWSDKRDFYVASESGSLPHSASKARDHITAPVHPPLLGRSIYYGAFIYGPVLLIGEQAGVLVQCAVLAILIWMALLPWRRGSPRQWAISYVLFCAAMAALTSLPFTASLLVPDYLSGVAIAALCLLLCFWDFYSRFEIGLLAALLLLAALSHSSNLPLILALSAAAMIIRFKGLRLNLRAALIGFAAVAAGLAGDALFVAAVKHQTGVTPIRPPFLTARLIADGSGHQFMQIHCRSRHFEVCRFQDRTPHDSDIFLWSRGKYGVFSAADFSAQRRLSKQDISFALATVRAYPSASFVSTLNASIHQLVLFDYSTWQGVKRDDPAASLTNLPAPVAKRMANTLSAKGTMPVNPSQAITAIMVLLCAIAAPFSADRLLRNPDPRVKALGAALLLSLVAIAINAAISGGLSKPDPRYSLKVIWVLPMFMLLLAFARGRKAA